jgi:ribosomal protein S4
VQEFLLAKRIVMKNNRVEKPSSELNHGDQFFVNEDQKRPYIFKTHHKEGFLYEDDNLGMCRLTNKTVLVIDPTTIKDEDIETGDIFSDRTGRRCR